MDAFYASVEQRDDPSLAGRAVIVGGKPDGRGVVAACSYEARAFGVHSAMPSREAARRCPDAIFLKPRMAVYREVSQQIRDIFLAYSPLVEPLSLDEAYLDVTGQPHAGGSAFRMARAIKTIIRAETGLVASAGVSYNKFLAKIASDYNKPDGLFCILPGEGEAFVATLPIGQFHGIGRVTEARMKERGIHNGADLASWPLPALEAEFGRAARYYHDIARGVDHRPVRVSRDRKSLGAERTYGENLHQREAMLNRLQEIGSRLLEELQQKQLTAGCVSVKVRFADFDTLTRAHSQTNGRIDADTLAIVLPELLARALDHQRGRGVRLLGVTFRQLEGWSGEALPQQLRLELNRP